MLTFSENILFPLADQGGVTWHKQEGLNKSGLTGGINRPFSRARVETTFSHGFIYFPEKQSENQRI